MGSKRRHFPYKHPTFGRQSNPKPVWAWQRSVYYWWFEYLKRHAGYARTCAQAGRGKYAALYRDFGDVHAADFRTWWAEGDRGARLFAEPLITREVRLVTAEELAAVEPDPNVAFVQMPLNLPKRYLKQAFAKLLVKHHKGRRGVRQARHSQARYPVIGQPNVPALQITLQVYDYRQTHPELTLWQIGQQLRLFQLEQLPAAGDTAKTIANKRSIMAASVSRYLRKAQAMIDNAALGKFPKPTKTSP